MSVGLFRLISAVKSVFSLSILETVYYSPFVFLAGCDDKAKTQELLRTRNERLSSIIRLAELDVTTEKFAP